MIRSMTGYARVEASFAWGRLSWELRSVNHRYFDVSFKVPEEFRVLEGELRQAAGGTISRGKVECGLRYARENSGSDRSEEHTSELQSLMRISYAVFCLKKKTYINTHSHRHITSTTSPPYINNY